jgi:hypothetical protein
MTPMSDIPTPATPDSTPPDSTSTVYFLFDPA